MHDVAVVAWLGGVGDGNNNRMTGEDVDVCCTCAITNYKKDDWVKLLSNTFRTSNFSETRRELSVAFYGSQRYPQRTPW